MAETTIRQWKRGKLTLVLGFFQILFLVLFAVLVDYGDDSNAMAAQNNRDLARGGADPSNNSLKHLYPMFVDVHVMIFIGFGFLMTFLKKYGFGSVGYNFMFAAFLIQWATLMQGFFHMEDGKIAISIENLLTSDFASAAVLISFGAMLGKLSHIQLILMGFLEMIFFAVNEYIGLYIFEVADVGGSMFVHVFGAYFGLGVSRVLYKKSVVGSPKEGSTYTSDLFSMIGTVFLWIFWPSFNSALAPGDDQHRAVINTYYSLAACCVTTFAISALVNKDSKVDMVHVQNSTLAGGVAVGTCANMMIHPWGAMLMGIVSAVISVVGFKWVTDWMTSKLHIHDTCGVNNLHGMPGLFAGIAGAIAAAVAETSNYGYGLYEVFPARAPMANTTAFADVNTVFAIEEGAGRTAGMQAGFQMAALVVTFVVAIVTGMLTGLVLKIPCLSQLTAEEFYDDTNYWEIAGEEEEVDHEIQVTIEDKANENVKKYTDNDTESGL